MNFHELIEHRESIRNYDPMKPVSKEVLLRILNAGRLAPSAANLQPWTFILVSSPEMLARVRSCYPRPWFQDASHVLIVKGRRKEAWTRRSDGYNSLETDLTIAMDHMILAAESEGVGTCWIAAFDPKILYAALNLKEEEEIFAITPLGYPRPDFKKAGRKSRKPLDVVAKFV